MPATTWKILNKNSPGTSTTFGADDWDMPGRYMNDIDLSATAPSSIKTNTSFWDNRLRVWNPAKTKSYRVRGLAILSDYDVILPLLTGNDEFTMNLATQEVQNKTYNVNLNTLRNTSNTIGQLLVGNGTKYLPLTMGSTAGHVLKVNPGVNGLEWGAVAGGGGGETNTASNVGTAGVGIFKQKSGVNLEFKKLNTASGGLITVVDDTGSSEVDLKIAGGTDGQFLKTVGTTPTWASLSGASKTMPDGSAYSGARWGTFMGGATDGDGILSGGYLEGTPNPIVQNTKTATKIDSGASDGNIAGFQSWGALTRRGQTPRYKVRFDPSNTGDRCWIGFHSDANFPTVADPLANKNGAMIGFSEGDTNYTARWNNGGVTPQSASTGIAKDTNNHTVEILLNDATSSVSMWFDAALVVNANTTQVPATTTNLCLHSYVQAVGAGATGIEIEYMMITFP